MKELILGAAKTAGFNLFDNVYDWSLKLTGQSQTINDKNFPESNPASTFTFESFNDVKRVIYEAYTKKNYVYPRQQQAARR